MFTGFERGAFEFFMALQFNNNREFFHSNHAWYQASVRGPLSALCMDLAPGMLALDGELEVRPSRVISHINRDLRFSRDKSPYRDYVWLGYHRTGWPKRDCFHFYFDISAQSAHAGAAMYGDDRAWMDGIRRLIREDPARMAALLESARAAGFELKGQQYRRIARPEGLEGDLARWYACRSFYLERDLAPRELESAALVEQLLAGFGALKPVYDLMYQVRPERAPDAGEAGLRRIMDAPDADDDL